MPNFCVIRTNQMNLIFKFIPINILYTYIEYINCSSSAGSLLYMQFVAFIVYPHWLAANTTKVKLVLGSTLIVLAASQCGCTINTTDCMYSKQPADDEQLIYSKHVEDVYWNKFKKKVHLVGFYYANLSRCAVHLMSNKQSCYSFPEQTFELW